MKISIKVRGADKFRRLGRKFRDAADGGLRDDLGEGIRRAAVPVLPKIRQRVRTASFPAVVSKGGGRSTGFRGRLADAVNVVPLTSPVGARFTVDGAVVDPTDPRGGHRLAQYSDGSARRRWRHRIPNGDPEDPKSWFNQTPDPWFAESIRPAEPGFRGGIEQAMDRTARRILR